MLVLCTSFFLILRERWITVTCYNVDEVWKHYSKSKKSVTRDHILYDSIGEGKYRKLSKKKKIESLWEKKYLQSVIFLKQ